MCGIGLAGCHEITIHIFVFQNTELNYLLTFIYKPLFHCPSACFSIQNYPNKINYLCFAFMGLWSLKQPSTFLSLVRLFEVAGLQEQQLVDCLPSFLFILPISPSLFCLLQPTHTHQHSPPAHTQYVQLCSLPVIFINLIS